MESWPAIFALSVLCLAGLAVYSRVVRTVLSRPADFLVVSKYRIGDVAFIGTILFVLGGLYGMAALAEHLGGKRAELNLATIIVNCFFSLGLMGGILLFLGLRGINPVEVFGLNRFGFRAAATALGLLVSAYPMVILAQVVTYSFTSPEARPQEVVTFLLESRQWAERLAIGALAVGVAPLTEELIFRGYLYGVLRKYRNRFWAMLVSAVTFAAIHVHLPAMPGLFVLALVLAVAYELTGSLWTPILMHACFNAVSVYVAIFHPNIME
ncbi:MAG TPA: CPBP family intramembrane glutamic endopeptidase [Chthoniobacterales bacterium]